MLTIQLRGHVTESGELELLDQLPTGLPAGQVRVTLEFAEEPWSDEEVEAFMKTEPKPGAEIVAALLNRPRNSWQDIADSVQWVEEQRRARRERHSW